MHSKVRMGVHMKLVVLTPNSMLLLYIVINK